MDKMKNYYLDEFYNLQKKDSFKAQQWFGHRGHLVDTYGWAIPNQEALDYLQTLPPIVEIGAGKGYWVKLLKDAGHDVTAFDISPPSETWATVNQGDESVLSRHDEKVLMLCWPPYGDSMALDCLQRHAKYGGEDIVYIGEQYGCTANDEFHDELQKRYVTINTIDIPSYEGIHDKLYHYKRKL